MSDLVLLSETQLVDWLRNGQRVDISLHTNAESKSDAAWTIHEVVAHVGSHLGGFMRIVSYPSDLFEARMSHPRDFLTHEKRWHRITGDRDPREILQEISIQAREKDGLHLSSMPTAAERSRLNDQEAYQALKTEDRELARIYGAEQKAKREYLVDKPRVDYVYVHDGGDRTPPPSTFPRIPRPIGTSYRKLGLGRVLYRVAAEWMLANDMNLYASDLQAPDGQVIWKKLEEEGWGLRRESNPIMPEKERVCIEMPEPTPALTSTP